MSMPARSGTIVAENLTKVYRTVTTNVLRAFADGPAADKYKATDNLAAMGEPAGSPINPGNLQ